MSSSNNGIIDLEPLDEFAFHGPLGTYVKALAPETEADPSAILPQMLALIGNMFNHRVRCRFENTDHHTNLYMLVVGPTTTSRKGTAFSQASAPLRELESKWDTCCQAAGLSSGEGIVYRLRDPVPALDAAGDQKLDDDLNPIFIDEGAIDKRLMVYETEFVSALKMFGREGNTLSPILRAAWDGNAPLEYLVKNSPNRATDTQLSIIGNITTDELLSNLTTTEISNGLVNRFMIFAATRQRLLPRGGQEQNYKEALEAFRSEVCCASRFADKVTKPMDFSEDAWRAYEELYGKDQTYGPLNFAGTGLFAELVARAAPQIRRLSLIYAVLDCSPVVELPHLAAAVAVFDYAARSTHAIYGDQLGHTEADIILTALRNRPEGMTRSEINKNLFKKNTPSKRIEAAIAVLVRENFITITTTKKSGAGRPVDTLKATPKEPVPTPDYLAIFRRKELRAKMDAALRRLSGIVKPPAPGSTRSSSVGNGLNREADART